VTKYPEEKYLTTERLIVFLAYVETTHLNCQFMHLVCYQLEVENQGISGSQLASIFIFKEVV